MPRFVVEPSAVSDGRVLLTGDNAHHAAYSLRLAVGDLVTVCDQTRALRCRLVSFSGTTVEAEILSEEPLDTEPPYRAVLFQTLPKGDKLDAVIQKAVECGVSEIVPFESSRCIMKSKPEAEDRKTERRCRIAEEAAKQSGRGIIPPVRKTLTRYNDVLREAAACDLALFCYEGEGTRPLGDMLHRLSARFDGADRAGNAPVGDTRPTIAIVIGSEGGFSPEEAASAADAGLLLTGLGRRILRTETAASFVLSCLSYQFEL